MTKKVLATAHFSTGIKTSSFHYINKILKEGEHIYKRLSKV